MEEKLCKKCGKSIPVEFYKSNFGMCHHCYAHWLPRKIVSFLLTPIRWLIEKISNIWERA